jgi:hypothetical protein
MLLSERVEHGGDDPAGIATCLGHVRKPDALGVGAHRRAQHVDVRAWHRYQRWFVQL